MASIGVGTWTQYTALSFWGYIYLGQAAAKLALGLIPAGDCMEGEKEKGEEHIVVPWSNHTCMHVEYNTKLMQQEIEYYY